MPCATGLLQCFGFRVSGFGFSGFEFRVSGFGVRFFKFWVSNRVARGGRGLLILVRHLPPPALCLCLRKIVSEDSALVGAISLELEPLALVDESTGDRCRSSVKETTQRS